MAREFLPAMDLDLDRASITLGAIMTPPPTRAVSLFALLGFLIITFCAAFVGARASISSTEMYATMIKPGWSPPGWLFGPVWSVLYCLMAVAAWRVWKLVGLRSAVTVYLIHLIFQALWSWLFFGLGRADWAMVDIVILWLMIAWLVFAFRRSDKLASIMMVPYLVWVSFAALLNATLWALNGGVLPR
jgi:tryptophan-rich sensory protein